MTHSHISYLGPPSLLCRFVGMSCSINMTSESWISFCTRGKYIFLNPTFLSKSFLQNIMIFIISFSSYCRVLPPEHIPLCYSDIWRQGQLPWLNFNFSSITTFIKNYSWQTPNIEIHVLLLLVLVMEDVSKVV